MRYVDGLNLTCRYLPSTAVGNVSKMPDCHGGIARQISTAVKRLEPVHLLLRPELGVKLCCGDYLVLLSWLLTLISTLHI